MLKKLGNLLLNVIYPEFCIECGVIGGFICKNCQYKVDFLLTPLPLSADSPLSSINAAFTYKPPISTLIQKMKYESVHAIALLLGKLLYFHTFYPETNIVTSVPLLPEKEKLRGFNQAKEIAKQFSQYAQLPYKDLLKKNKSSTKNQARIKNRQMRLRNIHQNAFSVLALASPPESVLIIDDVYTTGATLEACAKVLKQHGVAEVHGLVVAHGK